MREKKVMLSWKIFIHNSTNFDNHLLASEFKSSKYSLSAVPMNGEVCKILTCGPYEILDSFSFQSSSLSNLVSKLAEEKKRKNQKFELVHQVDILCHSDGKVDEQKYLHTQQKAD